METYYFCVHHLLITICVIFHYDLSFYLNIFGFFAFFVLNILITE